MKAVMWECEYDNNKGYIRVFKISKSNAKEAYEVNQDRLKEIKNNIEQNAGEGRQEHTGEIEKKFLNEYIEKLRENEKNSTKYLDVEKDIYFEKIRMTEDKYNIVRKQYIYRFDVTRQRSKISNKEQLLIEVYYGEKAVGKITTDIQQLKEKILELLEYGVVTTRSLYNDVCQCITDNYLELTVKEIESIGTELTDKIIEDIFEMFKEYIKESKAREKKQIEIVTVNGVKLYPVKINEFESYLKDSDYINYGISNIRVALRNKKYTKADKGRTDYWTPATQGESTRFRAICFFADRIDDTTT